MEIFEAYLANIENIEQRERLEAVLNWVDENFPEFDHKIGWNQPMFTHHGTFIMGFSLSKKHLAMAPEEVAVTHFSEAIKKAGYDHTKQLVRMEWSKPVDYGLLEAIIRFNIQDKAACDTFWRKK